MFNGTTKHTTKIYTQGHDISLFLPGKQRRMCFTYNFDEEATFEIMPDKEDGSYFYPDDSTEFIAFDFHYLNCRRACRNNSDVPGIASNSPLLFRLICGILNKPFALKLC